MLLCLRSCRIAECFDRSSTSFSESFILKERTNSWKTDKKALNVVYHTKKNNARWELSSRFLGKIIQTDFFIGMTTWITLFEEIYWGKVKRLCDTININALGGYNAIWNNFRRNLTSKHLKRYLFCPIFCALLCLSGILSECFSIIFLSAVMCSLSVLICSTRNIRTYLNMGKKSREKIFNTAFVLSWADYELFQIKLFKTANGISFKLVMINAENEENSSDIFRKTLLEKKKENLWGIWLAFENRNGISNTTRKVADK